MIRLRRINRAALVAAFGIGAARAEAQDPSARVERLLNPSTTTIGVFGNYWQFDDSLYEPVHSNLRIVRAGQVTFPIVLSLPFGPNVGLDISGGYSWGAVEIEAPDGERAGYFIYGPNDTRVRATVRFADDHVMLVGGYNAPTGSTSLDQIELGALRVLAAPALGFSPSQAGSGGGGNGGLVLTKDVSEWAFALGASYEIRGKYNPLDAITTGAPVPDYNPGDATHFTLGGNGPVGNAHATLSVNADFYTEDKVASSGQPLSTVQLGPTYGAFAQIDLGGSRFREFVFFVSDRFRSAYEVNGQSIAESSANYLNVGFRSSYPLSRVVDFTTGADARVQSGIKAQYAESIAAASATTFGATLGLAFRGASYSFTPFIGGQIGHLDPGAGTGKVGTGSVNMLGGMAGISFTKRY
jgi:hypothetical protein